METNIYFTKDIWEASLLYAMDKKLIRTDNVNGRVWFSFADRSSCEQFVEAYLRKDINVNAKEFAEANKTLKGFVFNKEAIEQYCAK